jgi:N6-adenosine-specific RNA methylase IME4
MTMPSLTRAVQKVADKVPLALKALAAMERQLTTAKTYEDIWRIIKEATALKVLMGEVAEVKAAAEDAILIGNKRIAEELSKVPKAKGGGQLGKGGFPPKGKSSAGRGATGIKHSTRSRLGKLADVSATALKATAEKLRAAGKDATVAAVVREITQGDKKQRRAARERSLAAKQRAMPEQRYGVIYADPPWRFTSYSEDTGMDRAADNHYPTMDTAAIAALGPPAADDAVLFLWATVPMMPEALNVMDAWGFIYKSQFVWIKDKAGTGFWNKNKHELLLIGTRGSVPAPAPGEQYESAITAPRGKHSAKPFAFREMIETMFPTLPRIELFSRERFAGWDAWGNELAEAAE